MNDEQLILYYYNDGLSAAERDALATRLREDEALRERYQVLCDELAGLPAADSPAPAPDRVARWQDSIDRAAALERGRTGGTGDVFHLPSFFWGTAITALLVAGIAIGLYVGQRGAVVETSDPDNMIVDVAPDGDSSGAFTRGLRVHFRESRQSIDTLASTASADREMLILHLVQQNRLFAREAKQSNAPELARVLRAFEPILMRLAAADISESDAERLQAQLVFELNVMLTKLESTSSKAADDTFESI